MVKWNGNKTKRRENGVMKIRKTKETKEKKDLKIKERLIRSFGKVTVFLSSAAVIAIFILVFMSSKYEHALQYYGFSQGDVGKAMAAFAETRSSLRGAIGYDEETEIAQMLEVYETKKEAFATYMADVELSIVTPEGKEAFDNIQATVEEYWTISDSIIEEGSVVDSEAREKAHDRAFQELAPVYNEVYDALLDLMAVNVTKGDDTYSQMNILKVVLILSMIVIVAAAVAIAMYIANKIADSIQKPLEALSQRMDTFSHGDLDSPFPEVMNKDEIYDTLQASKHMADNLKVVITEIGELLEEMANGNFNVHTKVEERYEGQFYALLGGLRNLNRKLDGTIRNISEASGQVMAGSAQLAESAQDLAEGATDQAAAIEELTATVENVTSISEGSAESATEAAKRTEASVENARQGRESMSELTGAMERIMQTSKEIENIIVTIEDIAAQTNLLSLNASIEAARAGEAGKGFAVVADQIGKLANDSAGSAVMTKELIGKALEEINKGNEIAETTRTAIGDILTSMEEFAETASNIADSSEEQANMLKEIEHGIEQISVVVESNSAASEETSAVSEELSAQATSLKEMVDYFKLRD